MLATSAHVAFERGCEHVIIVVEPGSEAAGIYARLGFRVVEHIANARRV